jgi:SSS family solute:Na+ symporter/sodium/pantothenate symporter
MAWGLFLVYLAGTAWLGWLGYRRTSGFSSFALGNRDLSPLVVGITLAASTASAATFIINPGFVYVDGFSAWFHMVVGTAIGFITMLYVLSFRFRQIGERNKALTIPDWIGKRYGSRPFALYFAILNLLLFAFVVLLVGGLSIVMQSLLGVSNTAALAITLVFVTGYVFIGGTYAHVLTNVLQGSLMIGVTILILGACVQVALVDPASLIERLKAIDPNLVTLVNREGRLFNDVFSIYVAGFIVGAVLTCQPHILTKALYVKTDREVREYLFIFTIIFVLFFLLGTAGFFAHLVVAPEALVDPATNQFRQDLVMTAFLKSVFPGWAFTVISVVLLAAAMSTLDGLLVAISTITANDLVLNLFDSGAESHQARMALALKTSHVVLVVIAVAAFLINLNPPPLLGVFGQVGVYGLAVASAPPLLLGVLFRRAPVALAWPASAAALSIHFVLYFGGYSLFPGSPLTFANPGVTAAIAALATIPAMLAAGSYMAARAAPQSAERVSRPGRGAQ